MNDRLRKVNDPITAEKTILSIVTFCVVIFMLLQVVSVFRLFGTHGIPHVLLLSYRILDVLVILAFFKFCGSYIRISFIDYIFLPFLIYPIFIGIANNNISISYFNDVVTFTLFYIKILIFRTIFIRIRQNGDLDFIFRHYTRNLVRWAILIALVIFLLAMTGVNLGLMQYYQAPAELTFATAITVANGNWITYMFIFILALLGGKRAIMLGILTIGLFSIISRKHFKKFLVWCSIVIIASLLFTMTLGSVSFEVVAAPLNKLISTIETIKLAISQTSNWEEVFIIIDAGRYLEWVSVKPFFEGWTVWIGNGYGFRYYLEHEFMIRLGRVPIDYSVSNSHFTPLGIAIKSGIIGVFLWAVWCVIILFYPRKKNSYIQLVCKLGFISMLVQSLFSFSFFMSFLTPIFVAGATTQPWKRNSTVLAR